MSKTRLVILAVVVLLVGLGAAWKAGWFERGLSSDPKVAAVQRLQRAVEAAPPGEEADAIKAMQGQARQLTPEQQISMFAEQQKALMESEEERLTAFFEQSEEDQNKELDGIIDKMQQAKQKAPAPHSSQPKQPPTPSGVTGKTFNDVTTPQYRALSQQYQKKLVGRMKARGITP